MSRLHRQQAMTWCGATRWSGAKWESSGEWGVNGCWWTRTAARRLTHTQVQQLACGHRVQLAHQGTCCAACRAHKLGCEDYVEALKARVQRDVTLFRGKFNQYDVFK
jgi:hypothetical protein